MYASNIKCYDVSVQQSLLDDPSHVVRGLAAYGVCKVSAIYWKYLMAEVIKPLLLSLLD